MRREGLDACARIGEHWQEGSTDGCGGSRRRRRRRRRRVTSVHSGGWYAASDGPAVVESCLAEGVAANGCGRHLVEKGVVAGGGSSWMAGFAVTDEVSGCQVDVDVTQRLSVVDAGDSALLLLRRALGALSAPLSVSKGAVLMLMSKGAAVERSQSM